MGITPLITRKVSDMPSRRPKSIGYQEYLPEGVLKAENQEKAWEIGWRVHTLRRGVITTLLTTLVIIFGRHESNLESVGQDGNSVVYKTSHVSESAIPTKWRCTAAEQTEPVAEVSLLFALPNLASTAHRR